MEKIFYTDGSCRYNPGPGGFGVVSIQETGLFINGNIKNVKAISCAYSEQCSNTTNNREEMKAVIYVLEEAMKNPEDTYIIYSDSAYVVQMCNDWIWKWANNGWQNSKKKTVENIDLVQTLYKYLNINFRNFQIRKTKGHAGILENELADALATANYNRYNTLVKDNNLYFITEEGVIK